MTCALEVLFSQDALYKCSFYLLMSQSTIFFADSSMYEDVNLENCIVTHLITFTFCESNASGPTPECHCHIEKLASRHLSGIIGLRRL